MKLSDCMPNLYKNNIEMNNLILSEENEFETHIKFDIDGGFADSFIKTATIHGVEKYENLLGIASNNSVSIEERRQNVIIRLLASVPYTYRKLCEILDSLFGKNEYKVVQDINNYTMKIITNRTNENIANMTRELLKKIIPANIEWEINLFETHKNKSYFGVVMHSGEYETFRMEGVAN